MKETEKVLHLLPGESRCETYTRLEDSKRFDFKISRSADGALHDARQIPCGRVLAEGKQTFEEAHKAAVAALQLTA
ncbi:MAG: hypothetical protein F4060_06795 [Holophagales bacterium]|nr:hypothetical protein [Holophagales bacterium]MYG31788.1 hypothetical protein [Holophagales bacterium]MYI79630.1 hypothetical protein [Holophagales bacterium]